MSDMEKNTVTATEDTQPAAPAEENAEEQSDVIEQSGVVGKIKKLFSVESPYADYAADNDKVSQMMYEADAEPHKPTAKDILRTILSALLLVLVFVGVALMFSMASTCLGAK